MGESEFQMEANQHGTLDFSQKLLGYGGLQPSLLTFALRPLPCASAILNCQNELAPNHPALGHSLYLFG